MDKQSFSRTFAALEELKAGVEAVRQAADELQQKLSKKDNTEIEFYQKTAAKALGRIEKTIEKIDMVLNENGSSNNHN